MNLLDDTPVIPGDTRPTFEHGGQARQVLNDAEEDLRDWRLEVDDVRISSHMLDSNLMPNAQNDTSYEEEEETIYADAPNAQTNPANMSGGRGPSGGQTAQAAPVQA